MPFLVLVGHKPAGPNLKANGTKTEAIVLIEPANFSRVELDGASNV